MNSRRGFCFRVSATLTALASFAAVQSAPAQWGTPKKKIEVTKYTRLSNRIQIPDLPDYAGPSQFLNGATLTGQGAGVTYVEKWILKDNIVQSHNWYKATLLNYGWKITLSTPTSLYANKAGNTISINFNGTYERGWGSEVNLNYAPKEN